MIQIEGMKETKAKQELLELSRRMDRLEESIAKIERAVMVLGRVIHNIGEALELEVEPVTNKTLEGKI